MLKVARVPKLHPSALVTVAYLKARLDEGSDHLGIFMPLLLDVIARRGDSYFLANEIQEDLVSAYSLVMPQPTIDTLLKRATRKRYLKREFGRYIKSRFPPFQISRKRLGKSGPLKRSLLKRLLSMLASVG